MKNISHPGGFLRTIQKKFRNLLRERPRKGGKMAKIAMSILAVNLSPLRDGKEHFGAMALVPKASLTLLIQVRSLFDKSDTIIHEKASIVMRSPTPEGVVVCTPPPMENEIDLAFDIPFVQIYNQFQSTSKFYSRLI
jgi:hypothetical protein